VKARGDEVRWRVVPHAGAVRLELQLVGHVVTQHVVFELVPGDAERLAFDLDACVAGHTEPRALLAGDVDARN
jgi:hypothetical protein